MMMTAGVASLERPGAIGTTGKGIAAVRWKRIRTVPARRG